MSYDGFITWNAAIIFTHKAESDLNICCLMYNIIEKIRNVTNFNTYGAGPHIFGLEGMLIALLSTTNGYF
jgi:hypothetical protein